MTSRIAIGYLIPEFPAQTHNFFWNERNELFKLGIDTCLISTRRPAEALVSHAWASTAQRNTVYLAEIGIKDALGILSEWMKLGPRACLRALVACADGCPPKLLLRNLALIVVATRLVVLVRRLGLAHVHVHSCGNAALIAMFANRLAGINYSLTLHGDIWDYGAQQAVKFRYAAFAITITRKLIAQIRETLKQDAPNVIGLAPMGVNVDVFQRPAPYKPWDRNDPLRLFSCGRLNFVKGHQDLIRAVRLLTDQGINAVLEIAGEDDAGGNGYRLNLESVVRELNLSKRVFFLGAVSVERVLQGLRASHLFLLASHHEPLGVAIMEAMSCATPVIATNAGGVPELIDHGIDGYLVAPRDPRLLSEAIKMVALKPELAQAFAAAGRRKVATSFRSDGSALELSRLLAKCLDLGTAHDNAPANAHSNQPSIAE